MRNHVAGVEFSTGIHVLEIALISVNILFLFWPFSVPMPQTHASAAHKTNFDRG